ncbi:hypothetical protein P280DRAFT_443686 [Massarina eburnea CBS 473.64]|uniref:DUF7820 domain-containing protein n=1 Tax=Massarina eburnea CBS 473.64 TaxID=1395130 RepID=A0A6A6SAX5_9PLEO|nr:hypothetical protein P280DRAFT_443686 [Massarina eburnea CBS 473.64]
MHRRNSNTKDGPPRPSHENADVFDDEFALDHDDDDFMPSVSDGFRPMGMGMGMGSEDADGDRQDHDRNEPPRPLITTAPTAPTPTTNPTNPTNTPIKSAGTDLRRAATRNSTAKVPFGRESLTMDRRMPLGPQATALGHRDSVSSTASFATTTRPDSPLGTGPSHPYGMYPQNTMARSSSVATTSTQQRPQSLVAMSRPAHPYGMYTQNVVAEDTPPLPQVQNSIPVGFSGINTAVAAGYHRQIGPDGEEQDIVGPDGHTEQLPPYSRYPEEGPTKASLAAEASAIPLEGGPNSRDDTNDALLAHAGTAPSSPVSPVTPLTPAIPPASVAPALLPQQRPETQTGGTAAPRPATTSESASLLTSSDEGALNEKDERPQSMKKVSWRKKRLWGRVPVTVALILMILLLVFALILGAAIGTFVAKNKKGDNDGKEKNKSGPKHDDPAAVNAPTNTLFDATPISTPSGLPTLPAGQFSLPLGFAQESSPGCLTQGNQYAAWSCKMSFAPLMLTVMVPDSGSPTTSLEAFVPPDGTIPYGLQPPVTRNETLQLVSDLDYKGYGPAWHFSARYDKLVVLSPDEFAGGSSLRKRQGDKTRHRFQILPGDSPWLCYWNQTYIEGYIYVKNNSTAATMTGYPTPNPTDPFGPMEMPSSGSTAAATTTPAPTGASGRRKREDLPPPFPRLPPYPRIVKIEERRLRDAPQPYCQKMQLLDNGTLAPATNSNGGTIVVMLQETDPSTEDFLVGRPPSPVPSNATEKKRHLDKRSDPSDACHCQWMFQ